MRDMIGFVFKNIDGQCYMRYGNPEPRLIVKNVKIIEKNMMEIKFMFL